VTVGTNTQKLKFLCKESEHSLWQTGHTKDTSNESRGKTTKTLELLIMYQQQQPQYWFLPQQSQNDVSTSANGTTAAGTSLVAEKCENCATSSTPMW